MQDCHSYWIVTTSQCYEANSCQGSARSTPVVIQKSAKSFVKECDAMMMEDGDARSSQMPSNAVEKESSKSPKAQKPNPMMPDNQIAVHDKAATASSSSSRRELAGRRRSERRKREMKLP